MNNVKRDLLDVVAQGYYGNRTGTEIDRDKIDNFILGYIGYNPPETELIDRTIIDIPNMENIVIVYNKYKEEKRLELKEKLLRDKNYVLKPLATIPESNIEIYSRCIVCRKNENGELVSLKKGDYRKIVKYLAE